MTSSPLSHFSRVVLSFGAALLALAQFHSPVCAQSTEPKPGEVKSITIANVPVQFRWIPRALLKWEARKKKRSATTTKRNMT